MIDKLIEDYKNALIFNYCYGWHKRQVKVVGVSIDDKYEATLSAMVIGGNVHSITINGELTDD
jgi:hypothetical protein